MNPEPSKTFTLSGMTCMGCAGRVQQALAPFADQVDVVLSPPQAVVTGLRSTLADLQTALQGTHYTIDSLPSASVMPVAPVSYVKETIFTAEAPVPWLRTYRPLLLLIGYLLAGSVLVQIGHGTVSATETMRYFMAGFFLAFSFFKLLDIQAFADAYAGYDLLAARWRGWGKAYPFVELGLGVAYLTHWQPLWTHSLTIAVMGFSAIGVIRAVSNGQKIRCACLGAVFNLPMSTVTIVEDLGMVAMALGMAFMGA
jgi:copper chaperone CopZ